jgi:hypothetical protein
MLKKLPTQNSMPSKYMVQNEVKGWGCSSVVKSMPCMWKALGLTPTSTKKEKEKK